MAAPLVPAPHRSGWGHSLLHEVHVVGTLTTIHLGIAGTDTVRATDTMAAFAGVDAKPSVLFSYAYANKGILACALSPGVHSWALDSGAFTAHQTGKQVPLEKYIAYCHARLADLRPPETIFALDVIGDWRASLKNTEEMWKAGIEAVPCFHLGEPESALMSMARDYPMLAIGGIARAIRGDQRLRFVQQCFARVWPKKIHGFGITDATCDAVPFWSVDSTAWYMGPTMGNWKSQPSLPRPGVPIRNFIEEVRFYLRRQSALAFRHRRSLQELA